MCKLAIDIQSYTMLAPHLEAANKTLNGIIHPCPHKTINIYNVTTSLHGNDVLDKIIFPNGENKFVVKLYNNRDKNILYVELVVLFNLVKKQT